MTKSLAIVLSLCLALSFAVGVSHAETITLTPTDLGTYYKTPLGEVYHTPDMTNYLVGRYGMSEYRNYVVFDFARFSGKTITSATLTVGSMYYAPGPSETWALNSVSSDIPSLSEGTGDLSAIFNDLGDSSDGATYIEAVLNLDENDHFHLAMSAAFIAAANAAAKTDDCVVACGGTLLTLAPGATDDQYVFGYTGDGPFFMPKLEVQYVPEPATLSLLSVFAVSVFFFARKHKA